MFTLVFVMNIKKGKIRSLKFFCARSLCEKPIYFICKYITLTGYVFSGVDQSNHSM